MKFWLGDQKVLGGEAGGLALLRSFGNLKLPIQQRSLGLVDAQPEEGAKNTAASAALEEGVLLSGERSQEPGFSGRFLAAEPWLAN